MSTKLDQTDFDCAFSGQSKQFPEDCAKICAIAKEHLGIEMTPDQAEIVWLDYSDGMAAGWMMLPERQDAAIAGVIERFVHHRLG